MAGDPEALAQLARLLGDERLRDASRPAVESAIEARFDRLVEGLVAEAAASDDVSDRDSGLVFVRDRLRFLAALLNEEQLDRLREALRERLASW